MESARIERHQQLPIQPEKPVPYPPNADIYTPKPFVEMDPERRVTFRKLIAFISENTVEAYTTPEKAEAAKPKEILKGLIIPSGDPRRARDQHPEGLITVGSEISRTVSGIDLLLPANSGVVFEPELFHVVARSPKDLAKATRELTMSRLPGLPELDEGDGITSEALELHKQEKRYTAIRSAIHVLDSKIISLSGLYRASLEDRQHLISLGNDLGSHWRAHYKAKNLTKHRKEVDERIHDTAELASKNLDPSFFSMPDVHRAIYNRLYNVSGKEQVHHWRGYIKMLLHHGRAKSDKMQLSRRLSKDVRKGYLNMLPRNMSDQIKANYPAAYQD